MLVLFPIILQQPSQLPGCHLAKRIRCHTGALYKRELLRMAMDEMDWSVDSDAMRIIEGRRYMYKGVKRGVAIDGNVSAYEYILEGLVRLQIGYDKQRLDAGVLLVNAKRSDKSPLGTTADLITTEIETLYGLRSM